MRSNQQAQQAITLFHKPTIAAINGFTFGGGLEVEMCCYIRITAETAKMANPEVNVGASQARARPSAWPAW